MTYMFGVLVKILDKTPRREQLFYLLSSALTGSLPLSPLSREDLRNMIENTLSLSLSSWPLYDSLCGRISSSGFFPPSHVLTAFQKLAPLYDSLSLLQSLHVICMLLTGSQFLLFPFLSHVYPHVY